MIIIQELCTLKYWFNTNIQNKVFLVVFDNTYINVISIASYS